MTSSPRLHPYQLRAAQFLRERDRAALWITMGMGKSAITLTALDQCPEPVLVIAPKKIAEEVWPDEVAKWRHAEATWDMLQFALRLGDRPRQVSTTTPRPTALMRRLIADLEAQD